MASSDEKKTESPKEQATNWFQYLIDHHEIDEDGKRHPCPLINKEETYDFVVGSCRSVPGFRIDIENEKGQTIDYRGLGTEANYVKLVQKELRNVFEKNGYKVKND